MERNELELKIKTVEDVIHAPKHQNSLNRFLTKVETPLENGAIGRILLISEEEVDKIYSESIEILKKEMLDDEEGSS